MPNTKRKHDKKWSLYPQLHDGVSRLLGEAGLSFSFHNIDDTRRCINTYDSNIMGRFICPNSSCSFQGWSSKMIPLTIRMYPSQQYNARVYHQRCKGCNAISRPILDDSYSERVAYRIKKWCGIEMDSPFYSGERGNRPHRKELCEGCQAGHCSEAIRSF